MVLFVTSSFFVVMKGKQILSYIFSYFPYIKLWWWLWAGIEFQQPLELNIVIRLWWEMLSNNQKGFPNLLQLFAFFLSQIFQINLSLICWQCGWGVRRKKDFFTSAILDIHLQALHNCYFWSSCLSAEFHQMK